MVTGKNLLWVVAAAVALAVAAGQAQTTRPAVEPGERLPAATEKPASEPAGQGGAEVQQETRKAPQQRSFLERPEFLFLMMGALLLMLFWSSRSRKKQETKRKRMIEALKKGEKITTIGGIVGTIIETRDDEVVVKVDETNNVRMRFAKWAIRGAGEEAKKEPPEDRK